VSSPSLDTVARATADLKLGDVPSAMAIRTPNAGEVGEKAIRRGLVRPDRLVTRWKMASRGPASGFVGNASLLCGEESASGLALMAYGFLFTSLLWIDVVGAATAMALFACGRSS
jgi:hypothetical protein